MLTSLGCKVDVSGDEDIVSVGSGFEAGQIMRYV